MRLLTTGGAGFIGSHVVEEALRRGWEVAVLDDLSTGHRDNVPAEATFFQVDIRNRDAVRRAFADFQPTAVSHQAAQASVAISVREPHFDASVNILGSINVLEAAVEFQTRHVVFASTGGAIYGEVAEDTQATVDMPPLPVSPYAASKFAVENYLRCFRHEHGLDYTVLRYANVYGPRQDPHGEAGVVAIFLKRLLAGESIRVNARSQEGDAGCVRDYVSVDDVVRANIAAVESRIDDPVLNVCTGAGTTTRELAEQLRDLVSGESLIDSGPLRPGDVERSVLCPQRFIAQLGNPKSLADGLQSTADWFSAQHTERELAVS